MSDDIIKKLRDAPRQPDCKHGNRPKSCHECEIEELEAEATASMTEIANLRAENERLRAKIADMERARPFAIKRPAPPQPLPGVPAEPSVTCPKCGMIWRGAMAYSCPHSDCPVQPKVTS